MNVPRFLPGEKNPRCPSDFSAMREVASIGFISLYLCNDCGYKWEKDYSPKKGGETNDNTEEIKSKVEKE